MEGDSKRLIQVIGPSVTTLGSTFHNKVVEVTTRARVLGERGQNADIRPRHRLGNRTELHTVYSFCVLCFVNDLWK